MTSSGRQTHPPKKKHAKRPRHDPIAPLSELDRNLKAAAEFQKSLVFLEEVERLAAWGEAPNACTHAAYYAMYHCASAAILASGGTGKKLDVPPSHEHVLQHFSRLVAGEPGELGRSALLLGRARTDRMVADYNLAQGATREEAGESAKDAGIFIKACRERWSFRP